MSPDGSPKLPPEEKLLRLIRQKSVKPAVAAAGAAPAAAAPTVMVVRTAAPEHGAPWLQGLVALLGVMLLAEAGWLVWQVVQPAPAPGAMALELPVTVTPVEAAPPPAIELPSLAASAARPLFALPQRDTGGEGAAARPSRGASQAAKELAARLSLNGIMGGEAPQAIIEDTETKKTFFVSIGQLVDDAVLEEVSEEQKRVILDLNGEKIELTL